MANNSSKRLLVEGDADRAFYSACCRVAKVSEIWIGPPTDFEGKGAGKNNAIDILPDLIDQMGIRASLILPLLLMQIMQKLMEWDFLKLGKRSPRFWKEKTTILQDKK